jgi:hypothetical protein
MLLPQSVTLSLSLPVCPPPSNSRCVRIPSLNRGSLPPSSQDQMISRPAARQCQQTSHPLHSCRSESPGAYQRGQSRYSKRLHCSCWRECRRLGRAFPGMNGRAVSVFIVAAPGAGDGQLLFVTVNQHFSQSELRMKDVSCGVLTSTFDMLKPSTACSVSPCQHNNANQCYTHRAIEVSYS